MSASAWFQCTAIALCVTPTCYWEIQFLTLCCYSGLNWSYFLRTENIELLLNKYLFYWKQVMSLVSPMVLKAIL